VSRNLSRFHALESNWTDLGEQPWDDRGYLLDLPLKWGLSFAIERDASLAAYIIGSRADDGCGRVNKIVVDRERRRQGLGRRLMERFERECVAHEICVAELKALVDNAPATSFYSGLGYRTIGSVEGTDGQIRYQYRKALS
jgi:ribosomal protein S18 acetylase RimI-like enzyme